MSVATQPHPALRWDGRRLAILDQTRLPGAEVWLALEGAADTAQAIRRLAVRGAPLIGVAAAYGLAMEVARRPGLGHARDGLGAAALGAPDRGQPRLRRRPRPRGGAGGRAADDGGAPRARRPSASTPRRTPPRRPSPRTAPSCWPGATRIATHCNTGALAAGGRGTALAVILELHERGAVHVLAGETRPLLQGARLTVWELARAGVGHELVVDGAMAGLIRRGRGRRGRSWAPTAWPPTATPPTRSAPIRWPWPPRAAGIPFVVAAPTSTIDAELPDGDGIEIEERDGDEVRAFGGASRRRCPAPACATPPSTSPRPRW